MTVTNQPFEMTPFLTHQIDVAHAMTYNELGVVLETGVKKSQLNIWDYNKLGVSILEDGIFSTPSYLRSHKDIAVRFLRASIKGWQWAVAHPTLAGQLTWKHVPSNSPGGEYHQIYMARQVAKLIAYYPSGAHHTIGYMDPKLFHRTWSTLLNEHVINHPPKNAYTQVYWQAAGGK
jgi:NitT/TauT family transport system substrate-binding protein